MRTFNRPSLMILIVLLSPLILLGSGVAEKDQGEEAFQIAWVYGYGSPVEFTVKASRGRITVAAGVDFVLEARYPAGWKVTFPEIGESVGGLLIREQEFDPPRLESDGVMVSSRAYRLEPLSPGLYLIPPLELMVSEGHGAYVSTLRTDVVPILVTSLLPEGPTQPRLLDMAIFPDTDSRWLLLSIAAGFAAGAGAGFFLLRRRFSRTTVTETQPLWKTAHAELDSLLSEGLVERGEYRLFYDRLFHFLRTYVSSRFLVRTSEKTTEELLQSAVENRSLLEHRDTLNDLLVQCDLGRFSPHPPPPEKVSENVTRLRAFLRDTGGMEHPDSAESDSP
jgi:hypothetical protein